MNDESDEKPLLLVTGSSGQIGTRLLQHLHRDYTIVGLDIHEPKAPWAGDAWHECDLTSDESVDAALTAVHRDYGNRVHAVVHLAAYYDFSGKPSPMYDELTVQGTRRLLNGVRAQFDSVGRFIFSSSLLVMRPMEHGDAGKIVEASPTRAEWDYPASKLQAEQVLREERGDIPVTVLRLAGVYDDECHSLPLSQHIRRINEKTVESYVFPGDADHGQPFIHLDDVATAIRAAIEHRQGLGEFELFLIAEPEVMSHRELQDELGSLIHGKAWPTIQVPKPVARTAAKMKKKLGIDDEFIEPWMIDLADDHYPVRVRRAREKLDWAPQHRLRDSLGTMIRKLKDNPVAWYEEQGLQVPEEIEAG